MEPLLTPWPKELVDKLNAQQKSGAVHPYTCGNCRDNLGVWFVRNKKTGEEKRVSVCYKPTEEEEIFFNDRELIATENGWICPTCDWKQNWCLPPFG
jgi:hypothetical protein